MNQVEKDIMSFSKSYYGVEYGDESSTLEHYGTKRHSGRYPWGRGENPYQRSRDFLARV